MKKTNKKKLCANSSMNFIRAVCVDWMRRAFLACGSNRTFLSSLSPIAIVFTLWLQWNKTRIHTTFPWSSQFQFLNDFNVQTESKLNSTVLTPVFTNKPRSPSLHPHSSLSRTLLQADVATWIVVYYSSTAQQRQTSQCSSPVFHTAQYATNVHFSDKCYSFFLCFHLDAFVSFSSVFISLCLYSLFICS